MHFLGINYRANVWVNGQKVGDQKDVAGTFRTFEFQVSKLLRTGKNAIALELFAPQKNDLGITWVDWNPTPADKDLGIWKEVFVSTSGDVTVRNAFVTSKLNADLKAAALSVSADVRNTSGSGISGVLHANVADREVNQQVTLAAGESKTVKFAPEQFPTLKLENPRVWWPYQMGEPNLYHAKLTFDINGTDFRFRGGEFRNSRGHLGANRQGPSPVQSEWPKSSDPRSGVGAGYFPSLLARTRECRPGIREGYGAEYRSA